MRNDQRSGTHRTSTAAGSVQLKRLIVCLALFLAVWIGRGIFPVQTEQLCSDAWAQLTRDYDLRGALDRLGTSAQGNNTLMDRLEDFCTAVFGPESNAEQNSEIVQTILPDSSLDRKLRFLTMQPTPDQLIQHYIGGLQYEDADPNQNGQTHTEAEAEAEDNVVSAGVVVEVSDYTGEALPECCTMDHISLGNLETMTPVMGRLSSPFGYRAHPTSGEHRFHKGADIAADTGTPILAFADGTVEFIGENNSFGQYIQLDHGNGVKSLYAHCSELCASKGDAISRGDQIALVGSTGDTTGPHLHLELKYQDTNLNPAYYVEFVGTP